MTQLLRARASERPTMEAAWGEEWCVRIRLSRGIEPLHGRAPGTPQLRLRTPVPGACLWAGARPRRTAGTGEVHEGFGETKCDTSRVARVIRAQGPC